MGNKRNSKSMASWGLGERTDTMRDDMHVFKNTPQNRAAMQVVLNGANQTVPIDLTVDGENGENEVSFLDTVKSVEIKDDIIRKDSEKFLVRLISETRANLGKGLANKYTTSSPRVVGSYLRVFDGMCQGQTLTKMAKTLGISKQRVAHMVEVIKTRPSMKRLYRELKALSHAR